MPKYKLTYFDIRGLSEPIRWMFAISGQEFEDERVPLEDWDSEKLRFAEHVGQLPLLVIDDGVVLTQVHSVLRYVARRLGFNGSSPEEEAKADEVTELIYELRLCCCGFKDCFSTSTPDIIRHTVFRDFYNEPSIVKKAKMRKELVENWFPKYFKKFAELLEESGGEWVAGAGLTYADLCLANFLDVAETMVNPDVLNDFPTLRGLKKKIFVIPELQGFIAANLSKTKGGG